MIILRLIIVTMLFVSAGIIQFSTSAFLPAFFYYLILLTYFLSLLYVLAYIWGRNPFFQACAQIFMDLILISGFVYFSAGLKSSFYVLYIFAIIASSIVVSHRAAYLVAALSGVFFGVLINGLQMGFIPYFGADAPVELAPGRVVNNIVVSWSMFFLAAFLSNYLTERLRRTAERLRLVEKELEIKKRLYLAGEFSAHLAHEIRNPLAAISGAVQVLQDELKVEGRQKTLMENIMEQTGRVSQSIEQFLNLVSPENRGFTDVNLAAAVEESLLLLESSGEWDGRYRLEGNCRNTGITYLGNPSQFKQLFWNLFRQALHAMPDGGVLTVNLEKDARGNLRLQVRDTGEGTDGRERLARPSQEELTTGEDLSFSVVRRIVDDYNGSIHVHTKKGEGTEVLVVLPRPRSRRTPQSRMIA